MAGFFPNLLRDLRISLCAKQVVTDIQTLSPVQGARLALMLALFRATRLEVELPESSVTVRDIVQHPAAYKKELCQAAFGLLEEIRQASRDKTKSYASFGVSPSPMVMEHTEICDLALSLLMSTVGVGCRPSTLGSVKYAWDDIATYNPLATDIDLIMKMPEYIVNDIIEQPLETDEWLALARKGPDFLVSSV